MGAVHPVSGARYLRDHIDPSHYPCYPEGVGRVALMRHLLMTRGIFVHRINFPFFARFENPERYGLARESNRFFGHQQPSPYDPALRTDFSTQDEEPTSEHL